MTHLLLIVEHELVDDGINMDCIPLPSTFLIQTLLSFKQLHYSLGGEYRNLIFVVEHTSQLFRL